MPAEAPTRSDRANARRARNRERIAAQLLGPVEELLGQGRSFGDLTVEQIIGRGGVPRSTFYYNFRDKGELLLAISESAVREIVEASHTLYRIGPVGRDEFTRSVRHTVDTWLPHVPLMDALAELARYDPRVAEQFLAGWSAAQKGAADHIREGQSAGTVRADLDARHTAAWLTWMAERGMSQIVGASEPGELDAIVESLAAVVWHTLYPDRA